MSSQFLGGTYKYEPIGLTAPPMTREIDFTHAPENAGFMMNLHPNNMGPLIASHQNIGGA